MKKVGAIILALSFVAKNAVSKLLGIGEHATRISGLVETEASQKEDYRDRTPQLEVTFEDENGRSIKAWMNLKGFKTFQKKNETDQEGLDCLTAEERKSAKFIEASDGYAVDAKTGMRIESPRKTESAQSIIAKLGVDVGIPEGEEFGPEDLLEKLVGIHVELSPSGQYRVKYTMPVAQVGKKKAVKA